MATLDINETGTASDVIDFNIVYHLSINETGSGSDSIKIKRRLSISEVGSASDMPIFVQNFHKAYSDIGNANDSFTFRTTARLKINDSASAIDSIINKYSPHLHYQENGLAFDNIKFRVFLNGQLQNYSSNDTWVVNSNTNAFSRFTNYDFNSFMKVGDKYYGANDNGLFDLTTYTNKDDTLEYIPAKIKTGLMNIGNGSRVMLPAIFISANNDGPITVNIQNSIDGQTYSYETTKDTEHPFEKRILIGRGFNQPYYQFEITNSGITNFELYAFALQAYITNRRS